MQGEMKQSRQGRSDNSSYAKGNDGRRYQNSDNACFNCGSKFHFRRNCPKLDRKPKESKEENQSTAWNSSSLSDQDLLPYDRTIVAAGGTPLNVKGKTCLSLTIGNESYEPMLSWQI